MIEVIRWNGEPISQPGIYSGIPNDTYHRADICVGPSVSSTTLRAISTKSPAHAYAQSPLNPNRAEPKESEAMSLGSALHWVVAREPGFGDRFVIRPETFRGSKWNGNRHDCQHQLQRWKRDGKTVLTEKNVEQMTGMAASLGLHPLIRAGILRGLLEHSMFWKNKATGLWIKTRPDAIPNDSGDFADLKTTQSVMYRDLQMSIVDYAYHQQGALILEGAREVGLEGNSFTLVWVESAPPYAVRVTQLKDEDLARGHRQNVAAMRIIADCLASGVWPGPGDGHDDAEYIDLPDWKRTQIDERLKYDLREAA
ncbi:hypothetical protein BSZ19_04870 [Bradyrhizobium japonicum]|uniref:Putative exodeoxyribonuclease 8 PDDEXK-like domain-containing protein n=1 Tax=Bradyrhizobium japonicum TaxID=375 RepID=A0A1Y2JYS7_BRAJP|nr:PD-(D/E)XK nuclease-like domain-containing protein [Bradyrhizobium japonicum]OSJ36317.1 hypothetical protein BSZ19_04870 [Bradyrhizobium japonicum]